MTKLLKVSFICIFVVGFNHSAQAQAYYRDITLKESLVSALYEYGKETFYRGLDLQEASFVFQRILVLDCGHQGAHAFLDKIHQKYPGVSIKIWGCSKNDAGAVASNEEEKQETMVSAGNGSNFEAARSGDQKATKTIAVSEEEHAEASPDTPQAADGTTSVGAPQDSGQLRQSYQDHQQELSQLENEVKKKDAVILDDQKQLDANKGDQDASFAAIAKDQKSLIRIQQSNIDYLKSELAEAKQNQANGTVSNSDEKYGAMHQAIADSHLTAQEKQMDLEAKDNETKTLRGQLEDLEGQLRLVQEIVNQKNAMIQSLQTELKAVNPVDKQ